MDYRLLNSIFTEKSMAAFERGERYAPFYEAANSYLPPQGGCTNAEVLSQLYRYMFRHYRNEYIYKDFLFKKLLFGIHSPRTSVAMCELPIGGSVADFVFINGRAVVYEIKTELDNHLRLRGQIENYYSAFRFVNIVCPEQDCQELMKEYADSPVGICVLTRRGNISVRKDAIEYDAALDKSVQFDVLRKREREKTIEYFGGSVPQVGASRYYTECLKAFMSIDDDGFQQFFELLLKKRGASVNMRALLQYPEEFKLIAYLHKQTESQARSLGDFLSKPYESFRRD